MKFTKMQGCGNDYVYIDSTKEIIKPLTSKYVADTAIKVSNRNYGIGSDGLILIKSSNIADFTMDMYNADGSSSPMCGNGIRCVGKYVYDYGLTSKTNLKIETKAGVKDLELHLDNGKVKEITVNMGMPILEPELIPVKLEGDSIIDREIIVGNDKYNITCVSMGNPHAIVFVNDTKSIDIEKIGPLFENHEIFPERVNTEFIKVVDRKTLDMRVWERGSGETLACGTGACASVVASVLNNLTEDKVTVRLLGGDLEIFYDRNGKTVYMTGPAVTVYEGEIKI
ncbi:MAG TPA: diaminopimelate epimerase [Clostridiales bacterium]|nr:diaminopimelate epimerase [Clostridiales bacterium]